MRIRKNRQTRIDEGDMTPMIDMTFQLIAFFMVIINFAQTEQNTKIKLPESSLVKPPEQPFEHQLVIHLTVQVVYGTAH